MHGDCQCLVAVAERSEHKERKGIDNLATPEPSCSVKTPTVLTCLPAREPPQKLRGLGEFFCGGAGETFPCWVWATPKVFCTLQRALAEPTSPSAERTLW